MVYDVAGAIIIISIIFAFGYLSTQEETYSKLWLLPMIFLIVLGFRFSSDITEANIDTVNYNATVLDDIENIMDVQYGVALTFFVFFFILSLVLILTVWFRHNYTEAGKREKEEEGENP